jgi:subfamily B ATP-binding cassette protein MsbA
MLQARTQLRGMEAPVDEIAACLKVPPSDVPSATEAYTGLQRGLVLQNISARYPQAQQPALIDITCTIPFGSVTAVAGYSGAGKSTLVALLLRFIKPESGQILVDGVEIERIRPADWHRRIAFVEQNAFLFNASVRDNIAYGDLYADEDAIIAAAQAAQADDFVRSLPQGYATMIGESGVRLSQGQRQRVALARSLLLDPDVLILDEATNALDAPTERALRSIVEGGKAGRAIIVIAHRRETIETADQVLVIDKGRLVQAGTPADLLEQRGVFAQLYRDALGSD